MNTADTLSKEGCAICSVTMALAFLGRAVTPDDVDDHMDRNGGYQSGRDGIGDWNVAYAAGRNGGPEIRLGHSYRLYEGADEAAMRDAILDSLRRNVPVIGRIRYLDRDASALPHHFVLIVGRTREGHLINDPGREAGDGASDPTLPDVVIETATRRGGLELVGADIIDVLD